MTEQKSKALDTLSKLPKISDDTISQLNNAISTFPQASQMYTHTISWDPYFSRPEFEMVIHTDYNTMERIRKDILYQSIKDIRQLNGREPERAIGPVEAKLVTSDKEEMRRMVREEMQAEMKSMFEGFVTTLLTQFEVLSDQRMRQIIREEVLLGTAEPNIRELE